MTEYSPIFGEKEPKFKPEFKAEVGLYISNHEDDFIDKQIDIEVVDIAYKTFLNIIKPN